MELTLQDSPALRRGIFGGRMTEKLKRATDQLWQPLTMFLAGVVVAGAASYFALWGAFMRESVSRPELQRILEQHERMEDEKWRMVVEQHKAIMDSMEKFRADIQDVRVQTGIEYGTALKRRK